MKCGAIRINGKWVEKVFGERKSLYLCEHSVLLIKRPRKRIVFQPRKMFLALSQELAQVKVISRTHLVFGLCRN